MRLVSRTWRRYIAAYRQYCWPVNSIADLKLAPFHLLASEGHVHVDKDHLWHMQTLQRLCQAGGPSSILLATPYKMVDVTDPASEAGAVRWWQELTDSGGEGDGRQAAAVHRSRQTGLGAAGRQVSRPGVPANHLRPGIHCPPNTWNGCVPAAWPANARWPLREFALGVESMERFVRREPLRRVHECVFGVLAMESESVDPRL